MLSYDCKNNITHVGLALHMGHPASVGSGQCADKKKMIIMYFLSHEDPSTMWGHVTHTGSIDYCDHNVIITLL